MRSDTEINQIVIAILTCARDGEASSAAGLSPVLHPDQGEGLSWPASPGPAAMSTDDPAGEAASAQSAAVHAGRPAPPGAGQQMLTAASYAMSLFHMLAAEFEAACTDVDVQAFLRRRALELAAGDGEAA